MNAGLICIPLCAKTADDLVSQLRRAEPIADIIEIRFDCLNRDEITNALKAISEILISTPLIATYRAPDEGGSDADLTSQQRREFWHQADGFAYVDLEQDVIDVAPASQVIASHHDFSAVPTDVDKIYEQLAASETSIIKIAATAQDISDGIPVWNLLAQAQADNRQIIPIAMGEAGKWTRILGLARGALLTYASLDTGKETAGGQLTVDDLINVYRVKHLDRDTQVYGVIGDPVSSSLSPHMHNAAFANAGLNAVFLPLEVRDLDAFMQRMVLSTTREIDLNFAGFAVTMPHKQAIQKYLTSVDPVAQKIGAANTVKITGDELHGYNTDAPGFISPLKQRIPNLKNTTVAIVGTGGAARAVIHALQQECAQITLFARKLNQAQNIADEFNVRAADLATINHPPSAIDLVVNTTPLGMRGPHEDETPLTADDLSGVRFVYDLVTRADDTPLIREAKRAGIPTIGGAEMLISQGIKQFEIWTGREAPASLMRQAVLDRLK